MAHNNFEMLARLISFLDHACNDIFIHIDKKAKGFDASQFSAARARLIFVPRMSVFWGSDSQIKCELLLLKHATQEYHDFYHLISGVDLPLKPHAEMLAFFEKNKGVNFVWAYCIRPYHRRFEKWQVLTKSY